MIYYSAQQLDWLLQEDIQGGDLTTRTLGISTQPGTMRFSRRRPGVVSGVRLAQQLLQRLGLQAEILIADGEHAEADSPILLASGQAAALHQGWKVAQGVLEWCGGCADYLAEMLTNARAHSPTLQIACTRKTPPGSRLLAHQAVLDGGGIIHRGGTAETILLFSNHRRFCTDPDDWVAQVARLRSGAPEKTIVVEADTPDEAQLALQARPDILQLDKFSPQQVRSIVAMAAAAGSSTHLSVAGGVNRENAADYAQCGIDLLVTSAPYAASPADIRVVLQPD